MIDLAACNNLLMLFQQQTERRATEPLLWFKHDGAYRPLSWQEVADKARRLAQSLAGLGIESGDRIVLVAENRPEWLITDLAIMAIGGISVPAYTTNTTAGHSYILEHSGAIGVVVSSRALAERLLPAAIAAKDCGWLVTMEELDRKEAGVACHHWQELAGREPSAGDPLSEAAARLQRQDTACFIYTSGTGGAPKGVMLSHGAMLSNCAGARALLSPFGLQDEVFLSFLPPSHAFEHTLGQFFPLAIGGQIYYGEGLEHLARNIEEVRPTLMACVPRLMETMHERILKGVARQGGMKARLFHQTLRLGLKRTEGRLGPLEWLQDRAMERVVRKKFHARFGGRLKALVSAGAALNPEVGRFFNAMGVTILQGYGQTEAGPMISGNPPGKAKFESVGPPIEGVEARIAEDGEILVRGEGLMQGYWRDEEANRSTLREGWLHTGDIGIIDEDGHIHITDRKKDIVVLSGGDNVSPARIESLLTLQPEIAQAMVQGDRRPYLTALIVPDPEIIADWAAKSGKTGELSSLHDDTDFGKALSAAVNRVNSSLSNLEKLRRFAIGSEPFTIENHLLTPTLKIRRHLIREQYAEKLAGLY